MTIRGLIDAVEAGTLHESAWGGMEWPEGLSWSTVQYAYAGSLDAAKALHDALLPGWDWTMHGNGQAALWPPGSIDEQNAGCIEADIEGQPARALLLAILRALEGGKG